MLTDRWQMRDVRRSDWATVSLGETTAGRWRCSRSRRPWGDDFDDQQTQQLHQASKKEACSSGPAEFRAWLETNHDTWMSCGWA